MMLTEKYIHTNLTAFQETDPWFTLFSRLHVASDWVDDYHFKVQAVSLLRGSDVYKKTKLKQESVEENLLACSQTSMLSFCALAALYNVNIAVVSKRVYFQIGEAPSHMILHGKLVPTASDVDDAYVRASHVGKPLFAVSYYALADLLAIAAKLRTEKGTKQQTYNGIVAHMATVV
jgi:hypothetical protein